MALNSINTNVSAMAAQGNIGRASTMAGSSIARLSSGNRIVRASDDVAAMSAGTSLRTGVTTLKMALINTSQGSSLLQVADGALSQISDILQRQKAIAVQAGSGSITSQERSFLNQEFQNLKQEVDRLATKTNFNGVGLLDGILSKTVKAQDIQTNATRASGSLTYSINAVATDTVVLNGVSFAAVVAVPTAAQFRIGATVNETLNNLANQLNSSTNTAISSATYSVAGNTLTITAKAGGTAGQDFIIDGRTAAASWVAKVASPNSGAIGGPDTGSFSNLVTSAVLGLGVANVTDAAVGAVPSATIPFTTGNTLQVGIGGTAAATIYTAVAGHSLTNIVDTINANTSVHGLTASIVGSSGNYNLQFRHANPDLDNEGVVANGGDITFAGTIPTNALGNTGLVITATIPASTNHNLASGLGGGGATGIGSGNTVGVGTIGNNLVTDQSQTRSISTIVFPPITPANLLTTLAPTTATAVTINIGQVASIPEVSSFVFSRNTVANAGANEIAIGATLEETIDNAVAKINGFVGHGVQNFDLNQIRAYRDGQSLVIESTDYGSTNHLEITPAAAAIPIGVSVTNSVTIIASSSTLSNGVTTGVSSSNVTNKDFIGTVSDFKSSYVSTNVVNLSVKVGDYTYTANAVATTPAANTVVRFSADGGGFFDVQMRANSGSTVTSQATADSFGSRLDASFATLKFYQNRDVASYKGTDSIVSDGLVTGSLIGSSVKLSDANFTSLKIEDISVSAPLGSSPNAKIEFTINGEKYTSLRSISGKLGANQTYQFVSQSDANRFIEFTTGASTIDFSTTAKAAAFQKGLEKAFGVGTGNEVLTFQVGVTASDNLKIGLNGVTAKDIGITNSEVLTQASAALAADAIDTAIDAVTSVRAEVGALQSRFNFAAANVESSIVNQDAARGVLLDTDIASESTAFATAQVQLQAGISVLAQANQLPQNLLKLIG